MAHPAPTPDRVLALLAGVDGIAAVTIRYNLSGDLERYQRAIDALDSIGWLTPDRVTRCGTGALANERVRVGGIVLQSPYGTTPALDTFREPLALVKDLPRNAEVIDLREALETGDPQTAWARMCGCDPDEAA